MCRRGGFTAQGAVRIRIGFLFYAPGGQHGAFRSIRQAKTKIRALDAPAFCLDPSLRRGSVETIPHECSPTRNPLYRNPGGNYSIWDGVLYGKVRFQPGLEALMNCSCTGVECDADRIVAANAWQSTTQTWHRIEASYFIDSTGDSIPAAAAGAEYRVGREARAEVDEDIEPEAPDARTMGNSLLIQGPPFRELRARADPADLAPPQGTAAPGTRKRGISA